MVRKYAMRGALGMRRQITQDTDEVDVDINCALLHQ